MLSTQTANSPSPPPLSPYRLYQLRGRHIVQPPDVIECMGDDEAIEKAKQQLDGLAIEVWYGSRLVTRLEPR